MKICILTHNYPQSAKDRNNAGVFLYDFAHELSKKVTVCVFALSFDTYRIIDKKVPVTTVQLHTTNKKLGNWSIFSPETFLSFYELLKMRKAVAKFVAENDVDFCLAAWAIPSGMFADYIKRKTGVKYGVWCLGSDAHKYIKYPILKRFIKRALKRATIVFSNSIALVENVEAATGRKCLILPAVTTFETVAVKPKKFSKNTYNFLFVGRLEKVKGPDLLIDACRYLKEEKKSFVLRIIGDGSMRIKLEETVKKFHLEEQVLFLGPQMKKGVISTMLGSDYLIIPSRNESLPLVMVEAAKAKLPFIVTDVGDMGFIVRKYKIGSCVKANNPKALAKIMKKVIQNRKQVKKNKAQAFDKIVKEFNQKKVVETFLKNVKGQLAQ